MEGVKKNWGGIGPIIFYFYFFFCRTNLFFWGGKKNRGPGSKHIYIFFWGGSFLRVSCLTIVARLPPQALPDLSSSHESPSQPNLTPGLVGLLNPELFGPLLTMPGEVTSRLELIMWPEGQAPLFQLVLMIHSLKVQHLPLIYSRQVNFVMFSFKTAVW